MKYYPLIPVIYISVGLLCVLYFLILSITYGPFYIVFSEFFLFVGCVLIIVGFIEKNKKQHILSYIYKSIRIFIEGILITAMITFISIQSCIIYQGTHIDNNHGEAALILGAQLNGSSISRLLRYRLESGIEFAKKYPDTYLIVSGGKGNNEHISEAKAMKQYLIDHGIKEYRILVEDHSKNTRENLLYSKKIMKQNHISSVSIITNDFHMFRANYLAHSQGIKSYRYPAKSDFDLSFNFYIREFFGFIKDFIVNHI